MEPAFTLTGRQVEAHERFNALLDYCWKLPRFIEREIEIETDKLFAYFPISADPERERKASWLRELRFEHEFGRLLIDFPECMGSSLLIQTVSLFEFMLLLVCRDIEQIAGTDLDNFRGRDRGARKLIAYVIHHLSGDRTLPNLDVIDVAIELRNCMAHANGLLAFARNETHLRTIIREELYLPLERRFVPRSALVDTTIMIAASEVGERILIPTFYVHWLCATARDMLTACCAEAIWPDAVAHDVK